ncbi:terminase small subunit [Hymenobacter nivis]|nr:terminase small subunit [Hymenobacter nivis]
MFTPGKKPKPKRLTPKQLRFVEEYCVDWNGTKAAERAGFSPKSARQQAANMLAEEHIQGAVAKRMEGFSMSAAEAIAKLADWGRGTVGRFLKVNEDGVATINLAHVEAKEYLHLLKKVKQKRHITRTDNGEFEDITTEIELHDAKDAVDKILKLHGRYAPQKYDHTTNGKDLPSGPPPNIYMPDNGR